MPNKSAKIIGQALAEAGPLKPLAAFQLNDKPTMGMAAGGIGAWGLSLREQLATMDEPVLQWR